MNAFDISQINELIHGRLRLGIMAYLSTAGSAEFKVLKRQLRASDGNLSVQLSKLEAGGLVEIEKSFVGKKPLTTVILTKQGKGAFVQYLDAMKKLLDD